MNPGDLNRRITIQTFTPTRDSLGAEIETWSTLAEIWAQVTNVAGGEIYAADKILSQTTHRITIYYRSDLTAKMRVVYNGTAYDVLMVQENGLRESTDLFVRWNNEPVTL
jgi:SPP1 family predicted phage head-tail adaptor